MGIIEEIQSKLEQVLLESQFLKEEIKILWSLQEAWIGTKQAAKFTGVSSQTLVRERERPNTLIRHKKEGKKDLYEVKSLVQYNNKKAERIINPDLVREQFLKKR